MSKENSRKFRPVTTAPRYATTKPESKYPGIVGLIVGETDTRLRLAVDILMPDGFHRIRYVLQRR